ncbi:hypothetical protein G7Z17_g10162 [Cylindrodendrum hubeiense]|uniref:AB hydrolase-1 domain-containing protein n=1 Tax=Cylindrodendrum hubeiense TaxID=595255 RepID=A0A9P5LCY4_9HYPO|nr:hypothetical protein G7Z17_g10162 [Cylindrodendrum hubeiense]
MISSTSPLRLLSSLFLLSVPALAVVTKNFTTPEGFTYVYDYAEAQDSKPTFLLLHGYPSSREDWRYQFADLSAKGFGVLAPDCLGYGDSDKPLDIEAYRLKPISDHLVGILDQECLDKVIGVGHDWGTIVLSRSAVWHPERFQKLAFLSQGYSAPGTFLDIDAVNAESWKQLGYMQLGYWYFLNSYNSPQVISDNLESFFHLAYHTNASAWGVDLGNLGSARSWLTAKTTTELPSYLTEEDKSKWLRVYGQENATAASVNYYRTLLRGTQAEDEAGLTDEDRKLRVPVLTIGGSKDQIAAPDTQVAGTEPWATNGYTAERVDAGHWLMIEQRENVTSILIDFAAST